LICSALIAMVLVAINASGATHPSVTFYARPLVFEFVFGIFAFHLVGWIEARKHRLPARRSGLAIIALVMLLACAALGIGEYGHGFGLPREISAGVPAFFLVVGTILVELVYGLSIRSRILFLVGESSYILYLIHPYVVYGILRTLFRHASEAGPLPIAALIIALLAASTIVAVAIHLVFEKPVMEWLRRRLLRARTARIAEQLHQPASP
jgi:peptidoglycan/LPS O-acetylase OafA/YrhL